MLALTKKTEYALIALHHMIAAGAVAGFANANGVVHVSAREIAQRYGVPLSLLMNILKELAGVGILVSIRGARGGYVLAGDPRHISLAKLIETVEGPVALVECACGGEEAEAEAADHRCKLSPTCPVKRPLQILHERLTGFLRTTSVYDVCAYKEEMLTQVSSSAAGEGHKRFAGEVLAGAGPST